MKIICVEGYKAFHGDMHIVPLNFLYPAFYICDKDWLYKPDTKCWYGDGRSFPEEICHIVDSDVSERDE
jgi:hypothetical protein